MARAPIAIATSAVLLLGAGVWARKDYRRWRALGSSGLPPTWRGWLRTTGWRMVTKDPFDIRPLLDQALPSRGSELLRNLPSRSGKRPQVAPYPVPHRQVTEHAPEAIRARLQSAFDAQIAVDPDRLCYALSYFEKNNQAVTVREECRCTADARATRGEIAHIHPSDGSMHMVLSARDAATAIERGWGERHGLAGVRLGLPSTYTLIYAPRDENEVDVDALLLQAAVAHMASYTEPALSRP